MSDVAQVLDEARRAFELGQWMEARAGFLVARERDDLSTDDRSALAEAAWWLGHTDEALASFEDVYGRCLRSEQLAAAAKLALEIGFLWMLRGEIMVGSGWISRARRLLLGHAECVEHGYMMTVEMEGALASGDLDGAAAHARQVQGIARRFGDTTLASVGLAGEGTALIKQGRVAEGMAMLDEAMLPVLAGEVASDWAGNLYCRLMQVCHELADVERARQWTDATERWCERFGSAVMFAGICRVHRAQLLHLQGEWARAETEAVKVCAELTEMNAGAAAEGHYQIGEVRRLRNDLAGAEEAYRAAHELGRDPQPGLALLRLAQGRVDTAAVSLSTALADQSRDPLTRARLRAAQVEIAIAGHDTESATAAAAALDDIAGVYGTSGLQAMADHSRGAVLLASGRPGEALAPLRNAYQRWQRLDAPHDAAKARVLAAGAYLALGDHDAATLELDTAAAVFDRLGAVGDALRAATLRDRPTPPGGLTTREAEVLACVATGQSNREIAATLFIADKTVARHLSNIFTKLDVASRTEAAAYAFEHGLVSPRRG